MNSNSFNWLNRLKPYSLYGFDNSFKNMKISNNFFNQVTVNRYILYTYVKYNENIYINGKRRMKILPSKQSEFKNRIWFVFKINSPEYFFPLDL